MCRHWKTFNRIQDSVWKILIRITTDPRFFSGCCGSSTLEVFWQNFPGFELTVKILLWKLFSLENIVLLGTPASMPLDLKPFPYMLTSALFFSTSITNTTPPPPSSSSSQSFVMSNRNPFKEFGPLLYSFIQMKNWNCWGHIWFMFFLSLKNGVDPRREWWDDSLWLCVYPCLALPNIPLCVKLSLHETFGHKSGMTLRAQDMLIQ